MLSIDVSQWRDVYIELAKKAYKGEIKPEQLDDSLITNTYNELNKGASTGYGDGWSKVGKDGLPNPLVIKMQQNLWKFSGAKTYAQLLELNNALTENGKILPWEEFKKRAIKLNNQYNLNYLQAEYQTAKQAGYHAQNWEVYQKNAKRYPNLKYRTQNDERVRDEHRALEGKIVPLNHPFWDSYYPPNGWRCRCFVEQTKEPADKDIPETVAGVKDEFKINTGKFGQVFKEGESYFSLANKGKELQLSLELSKANAEPILLLKDKGTLTMNPFADLIDLKKNVKSATVAVTNLKVEMHINANLDSNITGKSNPEYTINKNLGDRKEIKGYRGLMSSFDDLKDQGAVSVLFDLIDFPEWETNMFVRKLKGKLMSYKTRWIKEIIVEHKNKAVIFSGEDVIEKPLTVIKELKKLRQTK